MSVFFTSEPLPTDRTLAELWRLLESEQFIEAVSLAESVCRNPDAPIEYVCGLSLAYGELGYCEEAEGVARSAVSWGESHWRARHALAAALMHQGRYLGALDSLGFYRTPEEIYVVRAQVEKMGGYTDSLSVTLEDALQKNVPPALQLYLGYLYGAAGLAQMIRWGDHLDVWRRDADRHRATPYGEQLAHQVAEIRRLLENAR